MTKHPHYILFIVVMAALLVFCVLGIVLTQNGQYL